MLDNSADGKFSNIHETISSIFVDDISTSSSTTFNSTSYQLASITAAAVGAAATTSTLILNRNFSAIYNDNIAADNDEYNGSIDNSTLQIDSNKFFIYGKVIGHFLTYYYTPVLVLTGSIGNILSVFVFFKTKLRKLSSSYYLSALAISDTCFLFGLFVQWLNFIDIYLYNREVLCQFFTFFSSLCSFLSVWFVVAFTVERFIAVMYPLKRQTMCTVKRAKLVLFGLTILGCIHCTPFLYFASPVHNHELNSTICDIRSEYEEYMTILNYVDTVIVFVVPFSTIVILNTFTGCTVWKFATVRRSMTMQKRKQKSNSVQFSQQQILNSNCTTTSIRRKSSSQPNNNIAYSNILGTLDIQPSERKMTMKNSSQFKVTKMLLIVSTVFVCLNLPSYMMRIQIYLEPNPSDWNIVLQYICSFLFCTNFGINFVLYCVSGQNFRRAVLSLFRRSTNLWQRRGGDGATQVTVSEYVRNSAVRTSRRRTQTESSWSAAGATDTYEMKHIIPFKETKIK